MITRPCNEYEASKKYNPLVEKQYEQKFLNRLPDPETFFYNRNKKAISRFAVFVRITHVCKILNILKKDRFDSSVNIQNTLNQDRVILNIREKTADLLLSLEQFTYSADQDTFNLLKKCFRELEDFLGNACDTSKTQLQPGTLSFIELFKSSIENEHSIKYLIKDLDKIFFPVPSYKRLFTVCYEHFGNVNYAQFQRKLIESKYRNNQIMPINQSIHPIIHDSGGYCHGFSVLGAYQILAFNHFFIYDLNSSNQHYQGKMNFLHGNFSIIERCQNAQNLLKNQKETIILSKFSTSFKTTGTASDFIANEIYCVLRQCKEENFAILLAMRKNNDGGHDVGIVVKNNVYYLIDSNTGLFKFFSIDELKNFTAFLMKHYKYSHVFNNYRLQNMVELENCFSLPQILRRNITDPIESALKINQKTSCNPKMLGFMRDSFYTAYCATAIVQTTIKDRGAGFFLCKRHVRKID